jgi:hypothetical protein
MKTTLNRIVKISVLIALAAIVTGCCVAPFGYGHGHQRGYYGNDAPAPQGHYRSYR